MDYKIYVLDATGHVSAPPLVISCTDVEEAIRRAGRYVHGTAVEVWQDRNLIAKLQPKT